MPVLAYFPQEVLKSAYESVGRRDGLICCQPQQMMSFQDFTAISKLIFFILSLILNLKEHEMHIKK